MFPFDPNVLRILTKVNNTLITYYASVLPISDKTGWEKHIHPYVYNIRKFEEKDQINLQETLRVFQGNLQFIQQHEGFDLNEIVNLLKKMENLRFKWDHPAGFQAYPPSENLTDLETIQKFIIIINGDNKLLQEIDEVWELTKQKLQEFS